MPTVLRWNGYRFFFYSNEGAEPPHVHVVKGGGEAKVWLEPVALARSHGFTAREISEIVRRCREDRVPMREAWNDHFRA